MAHEETDVRYEVFISYRREDSVDLAQRIKQAFEQRKVSTFLDIEGLQKTGEFPPTIARAIANARVFVCLLGPGALESEWVQEEIKQACKLKMTIIPVMLPGFSGAKDEHPAYIHDMLKNQGVRVPIEGEYRDEAIRRILQLAGVKDSWYTRFSWLLALAGGLLLGLLAGALLGLLLGNSDSDDSNGGTTPIPPGPGVWSTNLSDGDHVAHNLTLIAGYSGILSSDLWVFVVNPDGRIYPQAEDACQAAPTPRFGDRWETSVWLGTPEEVGTKYDIVLAVADTPRDSQYIAFRLRAWCRDDDYEGFERLPDGLTEVHRISELVRTDQEWADAPPLASGTSSGQVTITSHANDAPVGSVANISGTYLNTTDDIWVLVYPPHRRWYPQSNNPCAGAHAIMQDGEWQVSAAFGDDFDQSFDVVVVVATPEASQELSNLMMLWCEADHYPGMDTIELPTGLDEKDRIRVIRQEEQEGGEPDTGPEP